MYISQIHIENFRRFGSGDDAFTLDLNRGLTALVGENDAGKTAVIDALRLVLGTRDQDYIRAELTDFHRSADGGSAEQILVKLTFKGLTLADRGAFVEYLTYKTVDGKVETSLIVSWVAKQIGKLGNSRRMIVPEWRTGLKADGPLLDAGARSLLTATYLRPLRDAERAMSAGRGSRLSQILQHTKEIRDTGMAFDSKAAPPANPSDLSVLGLGDYASFLFSESEGIKQARSRLNDHYLKPLSFANDPLSARIGVTGAPDDAARLRQLLEKLELALLPSAGGAEASHSRGLGSNNLLFMACELLLLAAESDGFPLLLIEEPEAHLHPQRQLRLMSFLQSQVQKQRPDGQNIQIIVTTHSPNLASDLKLDNLVLIEGGRPFSLSKGKTKLSGSDYRFLERFLDVTKANLFFARAVLIVEGDAENILLPVLAKLLGRDLHDYGVSIVNVGGVGLGRYARIFMREDEGEGLINIPVACVTDLDVMPDTAPVIIGKLKEGEAIPERPPSTRKWSVKADYPGEELETLRAARRAKASGQRVETFVADEWTFEYDLAFFGLAPLVFRSACLALADDKIQEGKTTAAAVAQSAMAEFKALSDQKLEKATFASHIYAKFAAERASKAIAAQYIAERLEQLVGDGKITADQLRRNLPPYIVTAIAHVTAPFAELASANEAAAP